MAGRQLRASQPAVRTTFRAHHRLHAVDRHCWHDGDVHAHPGCPSATAACSRPAAIARGVARAACRQGHTSAILRARSRSDPRIKPNSCGSRGSRLPRCWPVGCGRERIRELHQHRSRHRRFLQRRWRRADPGTRAESDRRCVWRGKRTRADSRSVAAPIWWIFRRDRKARARRRTAVHDRGSHVTRVRVSARRRGVDDRRGVHVDADQSRLSH